jgi:hypothetical protein
LTILSLSRRVRVLYDRAAVQEPDLGGRALLDLCARFNPRTTRADLMTAILASGIEVVCNERIRAEIDSYARPLPPSSRTARGER